MPPDSMPPIRGLALQRSMSTKVMVADVIPPGKEIWVDNDKEVWVLTDLLSQQNTVLKVRRKDTGEVLDVDLGFGETHPHNPKVVSDMTALHHIHEASILYNLRERSKLDNQKPYTFMGTILIAVNPLRRVENPEMSSFMNHSLNPETPHPYAIAELAYHQMRLGAGKKEANQSIVVSGESGAGKTETSKIVLRFLTHRSLGGISGLEQKVVDSSPILESFGNAKTLRNNNSSRFGKFLKMQFTKDKYKLAGAYIETYLLEKSRVLAQGQGERNFHILYELVAGGAASGLSAKLKLGSVENFRILSQSGCTTLDGVDDATQFKGVQKAFDTIGMDAATQMQVWQTLAAVLHMSNMRFDTKESAEGDIASISNLAALSTLASLLGVTEAVLKSMLTQRVVTTRGEVFTKQLSVPDADLTRDAIVKSLYEAMFLWIVRVINTSLGKGEQSLPFIGVLDIFGFENFEHKNEFEQLLINFTNESLQDTFNKQVFNNELRLYEEEGIEVVVSSCPDNTECLLMLSGKPDGIIPSLDNVCAEPQATDARYLAGLHTMYARHQDFPRTKPKDMRECFWVKHYAGKVKYTVEGWVERNMDRIPHSFNETMQSSKHAVVRESAAKYGEVPAAEGVRAKSSKTLVKPTVAKAFLKSMQDLNVTLLSTTCNFVRCIKPNAEMKCGVFNNKYVVEQLQCLGILQTCEVLKVGMPTRVTYKDLKEVLGPNAAEAEMLFQGEPETSLIASILWAFEVPGESYRLGKTRVFFRAGQISTLQRILNETGPEKAPWILSRLKEALANRQKAKAAAEEAQAALVRVSQAMALAEEAANSVLDEVDSEDDDSSVISGGRPLPPPVVGEDDLYPLEVAAKQARSAGSTASQVQDLLRAANEDEIGKHAPAAKEKVVAASKVAFASINAAASTADELEADIRAIRGSDEAAALRRLEGALKTLRTAYKEVKGLSQETEQAAAKCEVQNTQELCAAASGKASSVESQARTVANQAKSASQASQHQLAALEKAKAAAGSATTAAEKAVESLSAFKTVLRAAGEEEERAREAAVAMAKLELENKRKADEVEKAKAAADAAAAAESRSAASPSSREEAPKTELQDDNELESDLRPSGAPMDRLKLMRRRSSSVKDMLNSQMAKTPAVSPPPVDEERENVRMVQPRAGPKTATGRNHFENVFKEALEGGQTEGHLLKQKRFTARWQSYFFRLENGYLKHYQKKSEAGTNKCKTLELTSQSTTAFTNTKCCFCVRSGNTAWFLIAQNHEEMTRWMTAINGQIYNLWMENFTPPEDNYWSLGVKGRFFYGMPYNGSSQWIYTHPEEGAPRTGEGVFRMEVIEVVQVVPKGDKVYLRIADERGWTCARDSPDGEPLLAEVNGVVVDDNREYELPRSLAQPTHILCGPAMASEVTGEVLPPGALLQAVERFTPENEEGIVFIKLAEGRGWVPIRDVSS